MSRAVIRADLEEVHAEFYAAFEAGDFDRMSDVWAEGPYAAGVSCVHPGWTMLRGREEVLRSWALIMVNTTYIQFVLTGPSGTKSATGSVTSSNDPKTPVGTKVTATVSGYNLELSFWPGTMFCASDTPANQWNCGA